MVDAEPVPFLDLGATYRELSEELDEVHRRVMTSGWYLLGEELEGFEAEFGGYTGAAHCVGVASGLDALTLALRAVAIGDGDEVIVPSNTYIATWLAVSAVGAVPVPVEPDVTDSNIDPARIEAAITERTRAIMPVHLYGRAAALGEILDLARRHDLRVVEDAAQAHGAVCDGRRIGAFGDATAWSFYPSKNLGAFADAGAVTTDDPEVAARVRVLRNYGSRDRNHNEVRGTNSRLDELQAGFLRVKLAHLDRWNDRRGRIAGAYRQGLSDLSSLELPPLSRPGETVWHQFVVRTPDRDRLATSLAELGVPTLVHYPVPPHRQPAYQDLEVPESGFPLADHLAGTVLSLPIGPHMTDTQVDRVIDAVRRTVAPV